MSTFDQPDVIVIGSGAGGGIAAKVIAEGLPAARVVVLEKGPWWTKASHSNDELKYEGPRRFVDLDPLIEPRTWRPDANSGPRFTTGWVKGLSQCVGGGSVHWGCLSFRFTPDDFRLKTLYGAQSGSTLEDWPITYPELEPFYEAVEYSLGVQGGEAPDDEARHGFRLTNPFGPPRTRPFPMPPGNPKYDGIIFSNAAKRIGYHPYRLPIGVNSVPYRGRPACTDCGFCNGWGCPIGAKGNSLDSAIPEALATGRVQVRAECNVYRIVVDPLDARKATGVEYFDANGAVQQLSVQPGGKIVVACSTIDSPRLLHLSALSDGRFPFGLGNSSGMMGANFTGHHYPIIAAIMEECVDPYKGRWCTHGMDDFYTIPASNLPFPKAGTIQIAGPSSFGPVGGPIQEAKGYNQNIPNGGLVHKEFMRQAFVRRHSVNFLMIGDDLPMAQNRVDLDPDVRDLYGLPSARLTHSYHPNNAGVAQHVIPLMEAIARELGAIEIVPLYIDSNFQPPQGVHQHGTLRMGSNPAASVTDRWGKFHDFDNLYCADGSVMATAGGYNPTETIEALAWRTAWGIVTGQTSTSIAIPNALTLYSV